MTHDRFLTHMAKVGAAYRSDLTQATLEIYWSILGHFEDEDFDRAVTWAIKTLGFLPTPAALYERVKQERIDGDDRRRALAAPQGPALTGSCEDRSLDVKALIAELFPKLATAEAKTMTLRPERRSWKGDRPTAAEDPHNEAHLPFERGSAADMAWRLERAQRELERFRDYCQRERLEFVSRDDIANGRANP